MASVATSARPSPSTSTTSTSVLTHNDDGADPPPPPPQDTSSANAAHPAAVRTSLRLAFMAPPAQARRDQWPIETPAADGAQCATSLTARAFHKAPAAAAAI